jgi:sialic acid synthase SpsE
MYFDNLIILEFANNHMGDVDHGLSMVRAFADVCKEFPFRFAVKFQYRYLETFIHETYQGDYSIKLLKRIQETALTESQFATLRQAVKDHGFLTACTPFDETSVKRIAAEKYDIMKVASCSIGEWPLIEAVGSFDLPIIFSTAGADRDAVEKTYRFFETKKKTFAMLHCVGAYPTDPLKSAMNQLDVFRKMFPDAILGYSGHEEPDDTTVAPIAVAKGAKIFERHVALPTEKYKPNDYSSSPEQVRRWLTAIHRAKQICGGDEFREIEEKERYDLFLIRRACYLKRDKKKGETLTRDDFWFAAPNSEGYLMLCDLPMDGTVIAKEDLTAGKPVRRKSVEIQ